MLRSTHPALGIKGLSKLIKRECPQAVTNQPLSHYKGKTIAIDASNVIWQMVLVRTRNEGMAESARELQAITGAMGRALWMLKNEITPVFVFDGKRPELKDQVHENRQKKRRIAQEQLARMKADGTIEVGVTAQNAAMIPTEVFELTKEVLTLAGLPTVQAPYEAEAQCAELAKSGLVHGVATDDMDTLAFGAPRLVRGLSKVAQIKKEPIQEYCLDETLKGLSFSEHQSFVDLCIMLGCDYCSGVSGFGPHLSLSTLQEFKTLDGFFGSQAYLQCDLRARITSLKPSTAEKKKMALEIQQLFPAFAATTSKKNVVNPAHRLPLDRAAQSWLLEESTTFHGSSGIKPESNFAYQEARQLLMKHPVAKNVEKSDVALHPPRLDELELLLQSKGMKSKIVESLMKRLHKVHMEDKLPNTKHTDRSQFLL